MKDPKTSDAAVTDDPERDLRDAARRGDLPLLRSLLALPSINPNATSSDGWTAFHSACFFGHERPAALLLADHRVDVNQRTPDGKPGFQIACENGWFHLVELLLASERVEIGEVDGKWNGRIREVVEKEAERRSKGGEGGREIEVAR